MKQIWYVRDIASQGVDFFLWDSSEDAEEKARRTMLDSEYEWHVGYSPLLDDSEMTDAELQKLVDGFFEEAEEVGEAVERIYEMGWAMVPDDYQGEFVPNQED